MSRSAYGPAFQVARAAALTRSGGRCQFCGQRDATQAHHWVYPADPDALTADHLTGLCSLCHDLATTLRRFHRAGGDVFSFMARFKMEIKS